jgi:hypothetical protein
MTECLPPKGTPDNTFAWLYDGKNEWWVVAEWCNDLWYFPGWPKGDAPAKAWELGWRFHSIIEPPLG